MEVDLSSCWCCGENKVSNTYTAREMMYGMRQSFQYLECSSCRSIRIDRVPSNLSDYYPSNYYSFSSEIIDDENTNWIRLFLRRQRADSACGRFNPLGWAIGRIVPDYFPYPWSWFRDTKCSPDSSVLDVGCGQGRLLSAMRINGFGDIRGIDPYLSQPKSLPGLSIDNTTLYETNGSFDLVMSHHSMEHASEPFRFLDQMKKLCKPNKYILVRIPVLGGTWREYGTDWYELDAPRHLWIPTVSGFERLVQRVGGLRIEKVAFDTDGAEIYQSEMYRRNMPMFNDSGKKSPRPSEVFTDQEMQAFQAKASGYNETGDAGRAVFIIKRIH